MIWQNAHEWVRLNLRKIVNYYMRVEGIDLAAYLGITPECYDRGDVIMAGTTSWTDSTSLGALGHLRHAFPETKMTDVSFKRIWGHPQFACFVSDGDLNMLTDMRMGMGDGEMTLNRSGKPTPIIGCSFLKITVIRKMIDGYIHVARGQRHEAKKQDSNRVCAKRKK